MSLHAKLTGLGEACGPEASLRQLAALVPFVLGEGGANALAQLFEELRGAGEDDKGARPDDGDAHAAWQPAAAATLHYLSAPGGPGPAVLQQFLEAALLPHLGPAEQASQRELAGAVAALVVRRAEWGLASQVLATCGQALQRQCSAQERPSPIAGLPAESQAVQPLACQLTAPAAALLAQQVVAASCAAGADATAVRGCAMQEAVRQLLPAGLALVACPDAADRGLALRLVLPAAMQAAGVAGAVWQQPAAAALWWHCVDGLQQPAAARRHAALAALLQHSGLLAPLARQAPDWAGNEAVQPAEGIPPSPACTSGGLGGSDSGGGAAAAAAAAAAQLPFWSALRGCLVDSDATARKCAVAVLQAYLPAEDRDAPAWGAWLALHAQLGQFEVHLVAACTPLVDVLHPPCAAAADALPPGQQQREEYARGRATFLRPPSHGAAAEAAGAAETQAADAAAAGAGGGRLPPLPVCWECVIWQLALQHGNPRVQAWGLQALLARAWAPPAVAQLPVSFLAGMLLPALAQPVHHKVQARGDVAAGAGQLLAGWMAEATPKQRRQLAGQGLVAATDAVGRCAFADLLTALLAAAQAMGPDAAGQGLAGSDAAAWQLHQAAALGALVDGVLAGPLAPPARLACCRQLLALAARLAPAGGPCPLPGLAAPLLDPLPLAWLAPGGALHDAAQAWLLPLESTSGGSSGAPAAADWLIGGLHDLATACLTGAGSSAAHATSDGVATAELYEAWGRRVGLWARLQLVLAGSAAAGQLRGTLAALGEQVQAMYARAYLAPLAAERTLLLLASALDAAAAAAADGAGCTLQLQLVEVLASAAAEPLASYATIAAGCFWAADSGGAGGKRAWADASRAALAVRAAGQAAEALARQLAAWEAAGTGGGAARGAARGLEKLVAALCCFAARCSSPAGGLYPASGRSNMQLLRVLQEACGALARVLALHPGAAALLGRHRCCPSSVVTAVLCCGAPAAEAPAAEGASQGGPAGPWWPGVEAAMQLATAQQAAAGPAGGTDAPPHGLSQEALAAVLCAAVQALPGAGRSGGASQLAALLCLRWAWAAVAGAGDATQRLAADALDGAGMLAGSAGGEPTLSRLAEAVVTPLLGCLEGGKQRPSARLCAAVVAAAMPQALWVFDVGAAPELAALHCVPASQQPGQTTDPLGSPHAGCPPATGAPGPGGRDAECAAPSQPADVLAGADAGAGACTVVALPTPPLRQWLQRVVQLAGSQPRFMLPLALRLSSYCVAAPQLLAWYGAEVEAIALWGAEGRGGSGPTAQVAGGAPSDWALLAPASEPQLAAARAVVGVAPRLALVSALHQLAGSSGAAAEPAQAAGLALWRRLAATVLDPGAPLASDAYKLGGPGHRARIRAWQVMAALAPCVAADAGDAGAALAAVLRVCAGCHPPSVKQYPEGAGAYLLARQPRLMQEVLLPVLLDHSASAAATSAVAMGALALPHMPPAAQPAHLPAFVAAVLPWATHPAHGLRTLAALALHDLMDAFPLGEAPAWRGSGGGGTAQPDGAPGAGASDLQLLRSLQGFMRDNPDMVRLRRSLGPTLRAWSPNGAVSPRMLFAAPAEAYAGDGGDGSAYASHQASAAAALDSAAAAEGAPAGLVQRLGAYLAAERQALRHASADRVKAFETAAAAEAAGDAGSGAGGQESGRGGGGGSRMHAAASNHQRKGPAGVAAPGQPQGMLAAGEGAGSLEAALKGLGLAPAALDAALAGPAGAAQPPAGAGRQLIVVASLVDRPPNLGGLCRTCEVLGAQALVVADLRVTRDPAFRAVSLTAERWLPLEEVGESGLLPWLEGKRSQGYTLLGLEQTAESAPLPGFAFPSRTVLVLGREREGLPPPVLAALDGTVEIPQTGLLRSLNVHVAGALAAYEYVVSRGSSGGGARSSRAQQGV